jgi:hypothetical protein
MSEKMNQTVVIKKYMERSDNLVVGTFGKSIGYDELRTLSAEERKVLAEMCAAALKKYNG